MLNLMKTEEDEMSEEFVILLLRYYPQFHPHLVVEMALYLLTKLQNEWTSAEATQLCLETFFDTWARAGTITNNFVMQKLMYRILVRVRKFLQMTKVSRAQDLQQWQNAVFIAHLCTDVIHSEFIDHQMLTEVRTHVCRRVSKLFVLWYLFRVLATQSLEPPLLRHRSRA